MFTQGDGCHMRPKFASSTEEVGVFKIEIEDAE